MVEGYGRLYNFDYANYDTDPRPSVLVLGYWKHPTTGNTLLGGINLNYLHDDQILRLRQALKEILQVRGLKLRYRLGKRLLPDIFKQYRTYNKDHVSAIGPSSLKFWDPEQERIKQDKGKKKQQLIAKAKELKKHKEAEKAKEEPPEQPDVVKALALKRASQDRDREKEYDDDLKDQKAADQQQRKDEVAQQDAALTPSTTGLPKPARPAPPAPEPEPEIDLLSDPTPADLEEEPPLEEPEEEQEDVIESHDFIYSPRLGFVWDSPDAYIKWHQPNKFKLIEEQLPRLPRLSVYDISSGVLLTDRVSNHAIILEEAGWDYDHTVRFTHNGRTMMCDHDGLPQSIIQKAVAAITSLSQT